MLKSLVIKNYALIRHLEIVFSDGLNIITGETGAGKSIMLGALGLLKGQRANTKILYDEQEKCVVEALFDLREYPSMEALFHEWELDYESLVVFRREITASGKSRAFINDTPVNLDVLKLIGNRVMDIHSQHETLLLGSSEFQRTVLDEYAGNATERQAYQLAYQAYRKAEKAWRSLQDEYSRAQKEYDFHLHQLKELEEAQLETLDQEDLEQQLARIRNVEKIAEALQVTRNSLGSEEFSAEQMLQAALSAMNSIRQLGEAFGSLSERLESTLIEVQDMLMEVESQEEALFVNPEEAEQLADRLDRLYALQKKHQAKSVEALLVLKTELQERVDKVENFEEELARLAQQKEETLAKLRQVGRVLTETRQKAAAPLVRELEELLQNVGILNAQLELTLTAQEPAEEGLEAVDLLFSANKGIAPQPLGQVASGGEFSRLMLCLKYLLASRTALPTLVFDEIDTGISGEIAIRVGQMMQKMAGKHQLLVISHLPQIAAKGKAHFFVYKDNSAEKTMSNIRELSHDERLTEIARMIGGENPSPVAFENARELMGS